MNLPKPFSISYFRDFKNIEESVVFIPFTPKTVSPEVGENNLRNFSLSKLFELRTMYKFEKEEN